MADGLGGGPYTLPQLLLERARRWPDRICQRRKHLGIWQRYTWKEVVTHVKRFSLGLASLGLDRGETVAIMGENEPEHFWAEWAAQALGAKVVNLYPDLTPPEVSYILEHSEAVHVVAEDQEQVDKVLAVADRLPRLRSIIYWDGRGMWSYRHPLLRPFGQVEALGERYEADHPGLFEESVAQGKAHDVAVLSYTSGTTGMPKGVILTHANILDSAYRVASAVTIRPFSEYLSYISPAWATEQMFGIGMGLLVPMVVNFPEEPETVRDNLRELAVEVVVFSPRQWESLAAMVQARMLDAGPIARWMFNWAMDVGYRVKVGRLRGQRASFARRVQYRLADALVLYPLRDKLGLTRVRLAVSGGSAMAPDVFHFFHAMGVPLRNLYGTTEMGLFTMHQGESYDVETVGSWLRSDPNLGPPLEWKLTPEGELLVRGGSGFSGYYKNPEATEARLQDGWFRTGDAVHVTESGELVYLERVSDMRELATGHHFPPQFIETRLRFRPFIRDAMVVGDRTRPYVAALINIDADTTGRWAEQRGIGYSTFADLSQKPEVRRLIGEEVARVNAALPPGSRIRRFVNLAKELDPDEAELTRTRKLRRDYLEKRYQGLIEAIYQGHESFPMEVPVKYQDGRTGVMKTAIYINDVDVDASVAPHTAQGQEMAVSWKPS